MTTPGLCFFSHFPLSCPLLPDWTSTRFGGESSMSWRPNRAPSPPLRAEPIHSAQCCSRLLHGHNCQRIAAALDTHLYQYYSPDPVSEDRALVTQSAHCSLTLKREYCKPCGRMLSSWQSSGRGWLKNPDLRNDQVGDSFVFPERDA